MIAHLQHEIGDLIAERYHVLDTLGSGAFGTVYQGRDSELDTLVAIKELHVLQPDERAAALLRFRQEAVNLSQLRHPHIVSGYYQPHSATWLVCPVCGRSFRGVRTCPQHGAELMILKQRHYLVMELLRGPDLGEAARNCANRVLDVETALDFFAPIADALRLIHTRGLLHRDVKAENIRLRSPDDDPVLLDFGIASALGEEGDFSTRVHRHTSGGGTAGYAPSDPQERRFPDARSDIHALGMTLFSVLTGLDPLEDDQLATLRSHAPRQINPQISPALEQLISRSIHADARQRPANMDEWIHELNAIRGAPLSATNSATSSTRDASNTLAPFTFRSGERASNLEELVALLDRERSEAKEYLYSGDLAQWLARIGRMDLAQRAREIVEEYPQQKFQGLEALAQATALVPPPQIEIAPRLLDFGVVKNGERKTVPLQLGNVGRGHLFGILYSPTRGLAFPDKFDGNRQTIPISFESSGLARGIHEGEIVLDTSAGVMRLPMRAHVVGNTRERGGALGAGKAYDGAVSVVSWGVVGMLGGYILRALPMSNAINGQSWITSSTRLAFWDVAPLFGAMMLLVVFALLFAEATRRRSWWVFFGALLPACGMAALGGIFAPALLPAGDDAFKSLTFAVGDWASGAWMIAGGIGGALYGTMRHARDLLTLRIFEIIGGWTFFLAVLSAIVWLVRWLLGLSSGVMV